MTPDRPSREAIHQPDIRKEISVMSIKPPGPFLRIGALLVCLWLAACAPRGISPPPPPAASTDTALQIQAETAFQKGELHTALDYYQTLVQNFPDSPLVPAAFLKMGRIQTALGDDAAALESYHQLVGRYPETPVAMDARIEMLAALQRLGRNQEVIDTAPAFADEVQGDIRRFRLYSILGDAYSALSMWDQGIYFYDLALSLAPPLHRPALKEKITAALPLLSDEQIDLLLEQVQTDTVKGDLTFQQAVNMAGKSYYDDAVWHLETFLAHFPSHEYTPQARELIDQLKGKVDYDRSTLGCLLPLSGPYKLFGARALDGIQLAFSEMNATPGERPVKLVVKDTGSDPNQAARAMQTLADAQVAAVLGPIATAETAAEVAQMRRIPIVTLTQREGVTDIGDNVFRNFMTPRMQAVALAAYMMDTLGMRRFGILYPNENYGHTFRDVFWDEVYQRKGEIVALEAYDPQQTDFEEAIKKLVGRYYKTPADLATLREPLDLLGPLTALPGYTPPPAKTTAEAAPGRRSSRQEDDAPPPIVDFEALLVPDSPTLLGLVIPQLAYYDITNIPLLGTNLWFSEKLLKEAGEYAQGAVVPTDFFPDSQSPKVQRFKAAFEAVYGRSPGFIEALAYDSAMMLLDIIRNPDVRLRAAIRHALHEGLGREGVTGRVTFDAHGEPHKNLVLLQIRNNEFVEIDRSQPPPVPFGPKGVPSAPNF
jgi:ABC-type branched-subunit amino acid transport system substrate-binding protein